MDFSEFTEDDVVEAFKAGLRTFMVSLGGDFASRRVTLREEKSFPSDQEFALRLDSPGGFRLHLFGLQFKRWTGGGWSLNERQLANVSRFRHVIAYCLPRPGECTPSTCLHAFYFVNAANIPQGSSKLELHRPGEVLPAGVSAAGLAAQLQSQLTMKLASSQLPRIVPASTSEEIRALKGLIRQTPAAVEAAAIELWRRAAVKTAATWGATVMATAGAQPSGTVAHLCWGDFFDASSEGATIVDLFDRPGPPSDPDWTPVAGSGVGLTIKGSGRLSADYARAQIREHLSYWTRTALDPPAAIIAFESFSRSMEFFDYR